MHEKRIQPRFLGVKVAIALGAIAAGVHTLNLSDEASALGNNIFEIGLPPASTAPEPSAEEDTSVAFESAPIGAELIPVTIQPTALEATMPPEITMAPVTVSAPELIQADDCIGGTHDGWFFDPNADAIIDTIEGYTQEQKDFLKFSLRGVCETIRAGYALNPNRAFVQTSVESNSGQDSLSPYFNYHGHKAGKNDPYVEVWTKEDRGNGSEPEPERFRVYDNPMGSYWDYADMINRLSWYSDAVACRYDNQTYVEGLQHELDPATCEIVRYQGEEGVKSYATQGTKPGEIDYEDIVNNRAAHIKVDQYIYRP